MKFAVIPLLTCVLAVALADHIPITFLSDVRDDAGQFALSYQSADGTTFSEHGVLKPNADGSDYVLVKKGAYSYVSPNGQPVSVQYTSDEHGFRPQGAHIPK